MISLCIEALLNQAQLPWRERKEATMESFQQQPDFSVIAFSSQLKTSLIAQAGAEGAFQFASDFHRQFVFIPDLMIFFLP